ncbi:hypothetical protein FBU30_001251 [Linnemannia zychae]|nr:hypothetical protein FBU30_001251 [Linnemannia zychae]
MSWLPSKKNKEKENQTKVLSPPSPPNPNNNYHSHNGNGNATVPAYQNGRSVSPGTAAMTGETGGKVRKGMLVIRVVEARGLTLPTGFINGSTQKNQPPYFGSPTNSSRESLQRKWWLPYAVLEFDKNEILIDALGGEMSNPVWQYRAHFDVSRMTEAQLSLYVRTPDNSKSDDMSDYDASSHDIFLGNVLLDPCFDDQMQDEWFPLLNGTGKVRVQLAYKRDIGTTHLTVDSFDLLKVIGKGSFGKVMQVRKRDTNRIYAMKILRKAHIISRSEVNHTLAERTVLAQVNNPFIVPLKFSFQSPEKLYLVLAFVNGGELFHHLQREGRFSEERSRFYAAELLCALECLHGYNVVYRDLKPENILLDYTGHIALCDFGLCKLGMTETETTNTFCGTPEYLAPELLLGQGYTKTVDWWTLGVLLYEMLTGLPPFYDENIHEMYRKILQDELRFPDEISPDARSLLAALLTRDPNERLGNNGPSAIKQHPFFKPISFPHLMAKKIQPPFKPSVSSAIDTSNFDEEFTSEEPLDSVVESSCLSETVQLQFKGFTYNPSQDGLMSGSMVNPGLSTSGSRDASDGRGNGAGHHQQQANLQIYMTALLAISNNDNIVSSDSSLTISSSIASTYETVTTTDLFHYPESDFKDSSRHRAYLGQKSRERATRSFIQRKIKQGVADQKDRERIERKIEQRKNKSSGSDDSDNDNDNNDIKANKNEKYFEDDIIDSSSEGEEEQQQEQEQHNNTKHSPKKSIKSDRKAPLGTDASLQQPQNHRSNKRADRRRRPEDEVFEEVESIKKDDLPISSGSSVSSSGDEDDDDNESQDESLFAEEEMRFRFKHNLSFKTDDQSPMSAPQVDHRAWKRAFVQHLDELDQARNGTSGIENNGRHSHGKKHQKQKKNKGYRDYY